jgi:hypothetical protein
MNRIVLDVEGFLLKNNVFIAKELAIYHVRDESWHHYVFKPPFPLSDLSADDQHQCRWISHHLHHIPWHVGDVDYERLRILLQGLACYQVWVKGSGKQSFLRKNFGLNCHDLDSLNCPTVEKLPRYYLACWVHRVRKHCALEKAIAYGQFLTHK